MRDLQKLGGLAALIEAATFVVGFALLFALLVPAGYFAADVDAVQSAAFLATNQAVMYLWYLTIYVVFGVFLVVHSLALYERLKAGSPATAQLATVFGMSWVGLIIASGMVANIGTGVVVLGGGNEIVGGLWVLLVSWAALQAGGLPKLLNYFGLVVSVAGILTVVPALAALEVLGAVFGLGLTLWFI